MMAPRYNSRNSDPGSRSRLFSLVPITGLALLCFLRREDSGPFFPAWSTRSRNKGLCFAHDFSIFVSKMVGWIALHKFQSTMVLIVRRIDEPNSEEKHETLRKVLYRLVRMFGPFHPDPSGTPIPTAYVYDLATLLPYFCLLGFRLLFSWRPCLGPSAAHIISYIGLIVPAKQQRCPGDSACAMSACLIRFSFFFFVLFYFAFLLSLSALFFVFLFFFTPLRLASVNTKKKKNGTLVLTR